jgi:hypothetical protein
MKFNFTAPTISTGRVIDFHYPPWSDRCHNAVYIAGNGFPKGLLEPEIAKAIQAIAEKSIDRVQNKQKGKKAARYFLEEVENNELLKDLAWLQGVTHVWVPDEREAVELVCSIHRFRNERNLWDD